MIGAVGDPVGEQRAHALGVLAGAGRPLEPRLELDREVEPAHVFHDKPGGDEERAPLGLAVVAHVRRVAKRLGLLDGSPT